MLDVARVSTRTLELAPERADVNVGITLEADALKRGAVQSAHIDEKPATLQRRLAAIATHAALVTDNERLIRHLAGTIYPRSEAGAGRRGRIDTGRRSVR